MYASASWRLAILLSLSYVSCAPLTSSSLSPRQFKSGATAEGPFLGSLAWYPQQPDFLLATVSNNSTTNYGILAKNNLFDDDHPYNPLQVSSLTGGRMDLEGTRYSYDGIADAQFKNFPVGMVWQRYFNMSGYMPLQGYTTPTSKCFQFQLPAAVEGLNLDKRTGNQRIADLFFLNGLEQIPLVSNPIHYNVTVPAGDPVPDKLGDVEPIPTQSRGIYIPPSLQSGSVIDLLEGNPLDPYGLFKPEYATLSSTQDKIPEQKQ
ncbi:MAG: hypothetical protein Q9174_006454 [Haloplaca sp. 1 TL-2023]